MKNKNNIHLSMLIFFIIVGCKMQLKNVKIENVKIYGNCGMCKKTIETAANIKNEAQLDWNMDTKVAAVSYDSNKTNIDAILKRVALAGYDNERFIAPDPSYNNLHSCCQYERKKYVIVALPIDTTKNRQDTANNNINTISKTNPIAAVYTAYFAIKDALIKDDRTTASNKSKMLTDAIENVKMDKLTPEQHISWMELSNKLKLYANNITNAKDISSQREYFSSLSINIFQLIKVLKTSEIIYYVHCPMYNDGKGADWLSKEKLIQNPYFGSSMLTCGKIQETIK
ncbi:MAG: DUF3347 domain-containing protein [bacterium]|nr:DUF3347 domain-containing protein [bacterium]